MVSDSNNYCLDTISLAIPVQNHPIKSLFPYITAWSETDLATIHSKYFTSHTETNWFHYCILVHKADTPHEAVHSLKEAFRTHVGRSTLLGVVKEARNTPWCKKEVLDTLEIYAKYAYVLEGSDISCGALPSNDRLLPVFLRDDLHRTQ